MTPVTEPILIGQMVLVLLLVPAKESRLIAFMDGSSPSRRVTRIEKLKTNAPLVSWVTDSASKEGS